MLATRPSSSAPAPSAVVARSTSDLESTVLATTAAFEATSAALEGELVTLQQRVIVRDGENAALQAQNARVNAEMAALRRANDDLADALGSANRRADGLAASLAAREGQLTSEIRVLREERDQAVLRSAALEAEMRAFRLEAEQERVRLEDQLQRNGGQGPTLLEIYRDMERVFELDRRNADAIDRRLQAMRDIFDGIPHEGKERN